MAQEQQGTRTSVGRAFRTLKTGILGCLFVMSKSNSQTPTWKVAAALAIRFLQLFAFVISEVGAAFTFCVRS
jgi:hypothetical protein